MVGWLELVLVQLVLSHVQANNRADQMEDVRSTAYLELGDVIFESEPPPTTSDFWACVKQFYHLPFGKNHHYNMIMSLWKITMFNSYKWAMFNMLVY